MGRIVGICLLPLALFGCAGVQEKRPGPVSIASGPSCPTVETEAPAEYCVGLPEDYGLSRQSPVEWGLQAAVGVNRTNGPVVGSLYYGRLLCRDGSSPTLLSRSMAGPAPIDSTSDRSPRPKVESDSPEVLDYWKVQCGDTLVRMYSNSYRCGSPCVPSPFKLLPAAAWSAHTQAVQLQNQGRKAEALLLHEQAVGIYGESVQLQVHLINSYLNNKQPEQALLQAAAALQKLPDSKHISLLRVASLKDLGHIEDAHQALTAFFRTSHPDEYFMPAAYCYRAMIYVREGKHEKAAESAILSCQMGFEGCCIEGAPGTKGGVGGPAKEDSGI